MGLGKLTIATKAAEIRAAPRRDVRRRNEARNYISRDNLQAFRCIVHKEGTMLGNNFIGFYQELQRM
jgi:hypothetical protein